MPPRRRRPRGHIEELPSGSFRAVVYAGTDPVTGKERYLKETAKILGAAEVALTKLQRQIDEDAHPKTSITVGEAIDQWLDVAELEDTTRERYEDLVRIYIRPTFGDLAAAKLDAESWRSSTHDFSAAGSCVEDGAPPATAVDRSAAAPYERFTSSSVPPLSAQSAGGI